MLVLENVNKTWAEFQLKNINLEIKKNEFFVVLGPSGAGKTLLLEVIAGIFYPTTGRILFRGKDITYLPPDKRQVGFVFQDYALFPHKRVWQNVEFGLFAKKISRREKVEQVEEMLKQIDILHLAKRYPNTLSGGEQQRVALARALIINPEIFLLDEPLSALDYNMRIKLREEIIKIQKKLKITTIYVTHDRIEAITLADRIAIMNEGEIIQVGTPNEIFRSPRNEFVAQFTGFENIYNGISNYDPETKLAIIDCGDFEIQAATTKIGKVKACIRPEDVAVSLKPPKSSIRNILNGKIIAIQDQGPLIKLKIGIGQDDEISALITHQSFIDLNLNLNSMVNVGFKAVAIQIL
ncbi:MAG: ABC transporter ATP-binding protein [Candidatus Helarchaeota archaeon]|nr:ABC transporter ATP-binding protein [Candidatus Helarchaeota archaeon]